VRQREAEVNEAGSAKQDVAGSENRKPEVGEEREKEKERQEKANPLP
jgi:hypothetical protein